MTECPACGFEAEAGSATCAQCGLSSALFEPVRAAISDDSPGGSSLAEANAIVAAVGLPTMNPGAASLSTPARFPAPSPIPPLAPHPPSPPAELPELPALSAGDPLQSARRQVEEYVTLARRLALEIPGLEPRLHTAVAAADAQSFETIRAELFVRVAARLTEELERTYARRNEVAALLETATPDAELDSAREALGRGDLTGTHRRLRRVEEGLDLLEQEWETVRILSLEAELVAETVRELGGDPLPALGPLSEGRRRARTGDRSGAEPLLARSTLALWHLCAPLLTQRLSELRTEIGTHPPPDATSSRLQTDALEMARALEKRNYGGAVAAYRRFRDEVAHTGAVASSSSPSH
ncbi:MAG: hypothetical protein L3K13_07925 [Thermoplasmata archaeon]|nr:hypothetical protein [Thermoplasmata archaeon]